MKKHSRAKVSGSPHARKMSCEQLEDRRLLAVLTVNTDQDVVDLTDDVTSLREAIFAANIVPGADEIVFDFGHDDPATILLEQGELEISDALTITGLGAQLLTIDASGNDPTPDVNNGDGSRVFRISDGISSSLIDVNINGLALTGGDSRYPGGGAILSYENLTLTGSVVHNNAAQTGAGIYAEAGTLTIEDSSFSDNESRYGRGSAIFSRGSVRLAESTFTGNVSTYNSDTSTITAYGFVEILRSTLSSNLVAGPYRGGTVVNARGGFSLVDSTIAGNANLGGIAGGGAGLINQVLHSTVSDNDGTGVKSETFNAAGGIHIIDSVVSGNRDTGIMVVQSRGTAEVKLINTSVADNTGEIAGGVYIDLRNGGTASIYGCLITNNSIHTSGFGTSPREGGGGIRISGGSSEISHTTISDNHVTTDTRSNGFGGGILLSGGSTVISDCLIEDNSADGAGGGIDLGGTAVISRTSLINNSATDQGGGIISGGALTIRESDISSNTSGNGGGIVANSLNLIRSTISSNHALSSARIPQIFKGLGGGVLGTNLNIIDSTIEGNTALDAGGGLYSRLNLQILNSTVTNNEAGAGGGIWVKDGTISQSTISANRAVIGGGIYADNTIVEHSTVAFNTASSLGGGIFVAGTPLSLNHSIVARNFATNPDITGLLGTTIAAYYCLIGSNSGNGLIAAPVGSPDANGNLIGGDISHQINPLLAPLADNGGPTLTHALLPGSPAIDAGDPTAVAGVNGIPEFDQRGAPFARIAGGRIDIGAVERQDFGAAQNLVVDVASDEVDGDYSVGHLSLREAIGLANGNVGFVDSISFSASLSGGVVNLTHGELVISDSVVVQGLGADSLTIDASGNDPTSDVDNGDGSRIFAMYPMGTQPLDLTVAGLTLTGGDTLGSGGAILVNDFVHHLHVNDVYILGNHAEGSGGGIYSQGRGPTIEGSVISFNSSDVNGGGLSARFSYIPISISNSTISHNSAVNGGGIHALGSSSSARFTIDNSEISHNVASDNGGGIQTDGSLTLRDSLVSGNIATEDAGGMDARYATIISCNITGNSAGNDGGGMRVRGGASRISASTIADNRAGGDGGGLWLNPPFSFSNVLIERSTFADNEADGNGAGIWVDVIGILRFNEDTFSGNKSGGNGGAIAARFTFDATLEIYRTTIVDNNSAGAGGGTWIQQGSGTTLLDHSLLAMNSAGRDGKDALLPSSGVVVRYSLVGTNAGTGLTEAPVGSPDANGNLIGGPLNGVIDPMLGPLADNGGLTQTHALLQGSPAIDAGDPALVAGMNGVPEQDQRGGAFARIVGGRIDIGAFEVQPAAGTYDGDFDGDGDVDGRDFLRWQRNYGATGSHVTKALGDATGNGTVDGNDLDVWQGTYGNELSALSGQLSESQELRAEHFVVPGREQESGSRLWSLNSRLFSSLAVSRRETASGDAAVFDDPYIEQVDRAFDNWRPVERTRFDFGDIVTRRAIKPRLLAASHSI